jgi:hypothetical protein
MKNFRKKLLIILLSVSLFTSCGYIVKEHNPFIVGESNYYEKTNETSS